MRILSLETGSLTAAVAAVEAVDKEVRTVAARTADEPRGLARDLIGLIDAVLQEAGWRAEDLETIAVGTGPGSWTSLRVGLSTAKTLAQALRLPLAGIPTFTALADAADFSHPWSDGVLLTLAPCRPGELYGQVFTSGQNTLQALVPVNIAPLHQHLETARQFGLPLYATGDAIADLPADATVIPIAPKSLACALGGMGAAKILNGQADDPLALVPLYLAPSNAERNLKTL